MTANAPRTREDFLADCDPRDRKSYLYLFSDFEELAHDLEGLRFRLWMNFDQTAGWSLILEDLEEEVLTSGASLLWGFPSNNVEAGTRNKVTTRRKDLKDARIPRRLIDNYFRELEEDLAFERRGNVEVMTCQSGAAEGVHRTFQHGSTRAVVVNAIRNLVNALNGSRGS